MGLNYINAHPHKTNYRTATQNGRELPPPTPKHGRLAPFKIQFFVFEGAFILIVPLQEGVYRPSDSAKFPRVVWDCAVAIMSFYAFFGITCWAKLGDDVQTAMTASLPPGAFSTSVQIAYSIAIMLTFPFQMLPALEVTVGGGEGGVDDPDPRGRMRGRNVRATAIVAAMGLAAYLFIDCLGNVVSLLGAVVGIPLSVVFAPLMHNCMCGRELSSKTRRTNIAVSVLGMIATVGATMSTLASWDAGMDRGR